MSLPVRATKLTFKGDTKKKKRKHREYDEGEDGVKRVRRDKKDEAPPEAWVFPDNPDEIRGPTFFYHPSEPPVCVTYDATRRKIKLVPFSRLDAEPEPKEGDRPAILGHTPTETSQVWVSTRVAGSDAVNLRTGAAEGKFLGSTVHGLVAADREARGPQEEWTPVILPSDSGAGGMVAFQNVYEKYLAIDEAAGGVLQLRADSDSVGFNERFWVKVQGKYKNEAAEEARKKTLKEGEQEQTGKIDEASANRMYQTWGMNRSVVSHSDKSELKTARKDGRLNEALLDRRSKLKSDRFC